MSHDSERSLFTGLSDVDSCALMYTCVHMCLYMSYIIRYINTKRVGINIAINHFLNSSMPTKSVNNNSYSNNIIIFDEQGFVPCLVVPDPANRWSCSSRKERLTCSRVNFHLIQQHKLYN